MKNLFLSIGHDFAKSDQWAQWFWKTEAQITKKLIDSIIIKWIPWIILIKVPEWLTLSQRCNWINTHLTWKQEPFAIELHLDAWPNTAKWASAWYCDWNEYIHTEWWQFLQAYTQVTWEPSRHVNPDTADRLWRLWFVRDTKCASLLIELWFITNYSEQQTIINKWVDWIIAGINAMNNK